MSRRSMRVVEVIVVVMLCSAASITGGCAGGTIGSGLRFGGEPRVPTDANAILLTVNATLVDEHGAPLSGMVVHVESPRALDTTPKSDTAGQVQSVLFAEKGKPLVLIIDPAGANVRVTTPPIVAGQSELRLILRRVPGGRFAMRPVR